MHFQLLPPESYRRSIAPGIFDKMTLAIDNTRIFPGFGGLGTTDELFGFVHVRHFEHEKNVVGVLNLAPHINQPKTNVLLGFQMRIEYRPPPGEVLNPVTA
jgi:hypothetical protein